MFESPLIPKSHLRRGSLHLMSLWIILYKNLPLFRRLTELIVRKSQLNGFITTVEVNVFHSFSFAFFDSPLSKALLARNTGCPLSATSSIMLSAVLSQSPSSLWAWVPYRFFSDPGPRNDHCPCVNFRANSVTLRAFAIQFSYFLVLSKQCHCTLT